MKENGLMLKRILAWVIDTIVISAVNIGIYLLLDRFKVNISLRFAVCFFITVCYFTAFELSKLSATPGKLLLGICIYYDEDKSFLKVILRFVLSVITNLPLGFGFLYGFFSDESKTVADIAVKSFVAEACGVSGNGLTPCVFRVSGGKISLCGEIDNGGIVFGRDPEACNVVFPADTKGISRSHCNVTYNRQTGLFVLEDLGSSYGTFTDSDKRLNPHETEVIEKNSCFYLARRSNTFCVGFKEELR